MLKAMNLSHKDVIDYLFDKPNELTKVMSIIGSQALEGGEIERAKFNEKDSKVILCAVEEAESKLAALRQCLSVASESTNWIIEMLTEDRSGYPKEFADKINNAHTVSGILTIIDDIDNKIEEIKETLDDEVTLKGMTRKMLKAGVIVGAIASGVAAVGAVAAGASVVNSVMIDKGKSKLRQVMNELYGLRRKAVAKRDQLRKEEYASDPNNTYDNHNDGGNDMGDDDEAEESSVKASFKMVDKLLNM